MPSMRVTLLLLALLGTATPACLATTLTRGEIEALVDPPLLLGNPVNDQGVWELRNAGGLNAGYVFETEPLAPLLGFSGAPINMLVMLDLEGSFLKVQLIHHNEPIFVSGLGTPALEEFLEQYRGHNIASSLVVGSPYGEAAQGGSLVYLDGVTKATASVRIAHESILAATIQVAREKMRGVSVGPSARPDPNHDERLVWDDLVAQGLARNLVVRNSEIDAAFADTLWKHDDPEARANPDAPYLDLWIVDLGPPAIARAALDERTLAELREFLDIADFDEPILLIETARHGLVSDGFVRNTSPDWLSAEQFGLPVALRDSDIPVGLHPDLPEKLRNANAMILRTDRRLGFDPTQDWTLHIQAIRSHGTFMPETGSQTLSVTHATDPRFFLRPKVSKPLPPWREALRNRQWDLAILAVALTALLTALAAWASALAALRRFTATRLAVLAAMTAFVGWWGQGQLSVATVIGALRTAREGGGFAFLLYDPFSLLVWTAAAFGFVLWGRALFCGWLCPFGALQEFAHHMGVALRIPQIDPGRAWDARLKYLKYAVLAGLLTIAALAPHRVDLALEIEPFKTAITTHFAREWQYVAYAAGLLLLSMTLFKGFCRYLCPLGAVMAIGGLLRGRDWINRRPQCGTPCQLCAVRCKYGAIGQQGRIDYSECFGCLDCVKIHDSPNLCVPLVLASKRREQHSP